MSSKKLNIKLLLFFICICGLTILSCTRRDLIDITGLDGKWRMVLVKENATGLITTKPASIQRDVDITFTSMSNYSGIFFGNTPTNVIMENAYSTNSNQSLAISVLSMTKVAETSWGGAFVDNIRSSQEYQFYSDGKLAIKTTSKTLIFQKQ